MRIGAAISVLALGCLLASGTAHDIKTEGVSQGDKELQSHEMKLSGNMSKDMRMMNEMMMKHLGKKDRDYEKRFIDMMIPHHEGAVLMAKHALNNAKRPELKQMAEKMIKDQEKEI